MRFSKLVIKNFRSIGPQGLTVDFSHMDNLAAIIGANGSGKTNVLDALAIVLGTYPYGSFSPEDSDFYNRDSLQELLIELHLDPPLKERDVYQKEYQIAGFRFRVHRKSRGKERGTVAQDHYCFDLQGKTIVKGRRMFKKAQDPDDDVNNAMFPVLVKDHAWKIGNVYHLDTPGLERFFGRTTGWSPLARLFEIYRDDFPNEGNEYEYEPGKKMISQKAFEHYSGRLADILRTPKLTEIESKLSAHVAEYTGQSKARPLKIEFGMPTHRDIFEKWIELHVAISGKSPPLPVDRLGTGYKALLRLAVLETLLDLTASDRPFILLLEEPEIYLHIHLRRYFRKLLKKLADAGHQIIFTTHSPELVDLSHPDEVVKLQLDSNGQSAIRQLPAGFNLDGIKAKVARMGNEEVLFASRAVLLEGSDDAGIWSHLLHLKGVDPDVHSVSIVDCASADNLPDYVLLCQHLDIDYYVCHDLDDPGKNAGQKNRNLKISTAAGSTPQKPTYHALVPCLEAVMGCKVHCGIDRLLASLDGLDYAAVASKFPALVAPVDEFVQNRGLDVPSA